MLVTSNLRIPRITVNARLAAVSALATVVQVSTKPYLEFLPRIHGQRRRKVVKLKNRSVNSDFVELV